MEGRTAESDPFPYVTNDLGDIYARRRDDGTVAPFDPDEFGWRPGGRRAQTENPRAIDQLETLPGFSVTVEPGTQLVPGRRPPRPQWLRWKNGAAPPVVVESKGGIGGTHGHNNRLTHALGLVAERLPGRPDRSPFIVHDFVGGRLITVKYVSPSVESGGPGTVYVLDDDHAFKIGYTKGPVAARVADLQTGNPRVIRTVAEVGSASVAVEDHLQAEFGQWNLRGEWFEREPLKQLAADAGGWEALLRQRLPPPPSGDWKIVVNP
jgi:hypothetical protein